MQQKVINRFMKKVSMHPNNKGCLEWMGKMAREGYGSFRHKRKNFFAHRFAWMLVNGDIPKGMLICHHCDNPRCVNTTHLFLGTHKDNMKDKTIKGRNNAPRGVRQWKNKLTDARVMVIRAEHGKMTSKELALLFGVQRKHISSIQNYRSWKHLP